MAEAAEAIAGYVARGRASFDHDPAIRDAILYQIIVLGDAAKAALVARSFGQQRVMRCRRSGVQWARLSWCWVERRRHRIVWRPTAPLTPCSPPIAPLA